MIEKLEKQIYVKSCFKLEKSCVRTIEMIKTAFGDECVGNTRINGWYKWFKDGHTSVDSDPHSGCPSVARTNDNIQHMRLAINEDCQLTVQELADDFGMVKCSV